MKTMGIGFRLTFWYSLTLIAAIILIFVSFYFTTLQVFKIQTDKLLISHSSKIIEVVGNQAYNIHDTTAKEAFTHEFSENPGLLVVILNSAGTVVSSSQVLNTNDGTIGDLFDSAAKSKRSFFVDRSLSAQKFRFLVNPIYRDDTLLGVVIMGQSVDVIRNSLDQLTDTLFVVLLTLLLPAILGGYLNARGAISPISTISARLKRINSGNLKERLDNPKTGDEIEELSVTFNSLLDRLSSAFERERQFIGDVAHEVKTPLAAQRTNIEVALAKDRTKAYYRKALEESLVDNNQLSTTLKNILDVAWSEADSAHSQFEMFDVSQVATEIMDLGVKMALKKQITIKGTIKPSIIISGKPDKLERAFINLVDNAIKYTPQNGTVTILLDVRENQAQFSVKDTGKGILESDIPHIFDRFYRGSKTDKILGSGLGLSIAQAIVKAHGGTISVKSLVGRGSEFVVQIPLSQNNGHKH